uniref:Immunoglobulin V-set domain-containing protein n=1 Tax=Maylandia zebra TaxID=106582 RepID=A0A3P9C003_9CICH
MSTYVTSTVLHTGLTDGSDVEQTPTLWEREGESATMQCNHTKDMYWYQQLPGKGMKQIVFTTAYSTHTYETQSHAPVTFSFMVWQYIFLKTLILHQADTLTVGSTHRMKFYSKASLLRKLGNPKQS